jgi:O-antigen/teichoic acid export membrane protein
VTLSQKTLTGVIWSFSEQLGRRGMGIAVTLLLARFLSPADFGLVAMMAIFLSVATSLMDSGFKQALIRLHEADQIDFNTTFYSNLVLGMLSYALLFAVAPFIANFYDEPRLIALIRVAGIAILINSFQVVQSAVLSRNLNFKAQLHATMPAGIISGLIAVGLAYVGLGVWALIAQMLFAAFITTVLLWYLQGWRPSRGFSRRSLGSMYKFGYKLFLSGLLDIAFKNIYVVVIAKIFAASIAGYYFFAQKIKELIISQLVGVIQNVSYPALSTMQQDNVRLKAGYRKILQVTTFLLFPAMALLAALAGPLFRIALSDRWLPALPYLQLMCIVGLLYPLHSINLNILKVKGRSDLFFYLEIYKKIVSSLILFVSIRYGVIGVLIGQGIGSILAYIPNSYFSSRLIDYPIYEQMIDFMPSLLLSAAVALLIYVAGFLMKWPAVVEFIVLGLLAALLYLYGAYLFKIKALILMREMAKGRIVRLTRMKVKGAH